jgi:hypothetical protein
VQWIHLHHYSFVLYGALGLTMMAAVCVFLSVEKERQFVVWNEMHQALRWGLTSFLRHGKQFYSSDEADLLLESMGLRKFVSSGTLKVIRDGLTLMLLVIIGVRVPAGELVRPLTWLVLFYFTLTPGPGPFYLLLRPLFQRIHRYRVDRDSALLIQLFRNEMRSNVQRSVGSLIRDFRPYMTVIRDDLFWLEHEWQKVDKEKALSLWERKHPGNPDIRFLGSFLRKLDQIGYAECAEMLAQNERTLNRRHATSYMNRMQDLNRFLFIVNASGVLLACFWFVMAVFAWANDMDAGF